MNDNMLQINQIAEILAENVPEVDLVILYGSFAHGLGHELSDYDILAICDSKKIVWEFMLNERPVQIWSMTWKYAEEVITGQSGCWSTSAGSLAKGIIIWEKSSELHERFERIISKVREGGRTVVNQTLNFDDLFSRLWLIERSIRTGKDTNIRLLVWDLAIGICHRLAGLNNQYYLRNWGKQLSEIEKFTLKPDNFAQRFENLITANPKKVLEIAEKLVDDLHVLYKEWLENNIKIPETDSKGIIAQWSSVIEGLNSIKHSAKKNDIPGGIYAVSDFTEYIIWAYMILQNKRWDRNSFYLVGDYIKRLPDDVRRQVEILLLSSKMDELAATAEKIVEHYKQQLLDKDAKLPIAKSIKEGLEFLNLEEI